MVQWRGFIVGVVLALGLALFLAIDSQESQKSEGVVSTEGYTISARFENVGYLKLQAPVTLAGVPIGRVSAIALDPETFEAVVTLRMDAEYNAIPDDTFAGVFTAGLMGEQYIGLSPGGSETFLKQGSQITLTQSALVLEEIVGQFLFSKAEEGEEE